MNKQIDEMIEAIKKCSCVYTDCEQECSQCSNEELYDEALNHIARTFYEAGYRKASEVVLEVFALLEEECSKVVGYSYSFGNIRSVIESIKNKYKN